MMKKKCTKCGGPLPNADWWTLDYCITCRASMDRETDPESVDWFPWDDVEVQG